MFFPKRSYPLQMALQTLYFLHSGCKSCRNFRYYSWWFLYLILFEEPCLPYYCQAFRLWASPKRTAFLQQEAWLILTDNTNPTVFLTDLVLVSAFSPNRKDIQGTGRNTPDMSHSKHRFRLHMRADYP
jgi:hypothetical protein